MRRSRESLGIVNCVKLPRQLGIVHLAMFAISVVWLETGHNSTPSTTTDVARVGVDNMVGDAVVVSDKKVASVQFTGFRVLTVEDPSSLFAIHQPHRCISQPYSEAQQQPEAFVEKRRGDHRFPPLVHLIIELHMFHGGVKIKITTTIVRRLVRKGRRGCFIRFHR